jgi:hypothetical protein
MTMAATQHCWDVKSCLKKPGILRCAGEPRQRAGRPDWLLMVRFPMNAWSVMPSYPTMMSAISWISPPMFGGEALFWPSSSLRRY